MKRLIEADCSLPDSTELTELLRWGYAQREGNLISASGAGKIAWDTWQNMKDLSR